jgi:DNA transformation protein and related proteins
MAVSRGFQEFVVDLLAALDPMPRRMFGGVGLFHGGVMFGLLVNDTLYLRTDDQTRDRFVNAGSLPFSYMRAGREVSLAAYYLAPEDLLDRHDDLLRWAREAVEAARRAASGAPRSTERRDRGKSRA